MNRLTRITTGSGDQGTTGLADGSRLPKHHLRLECLGAQDELLAQLGLVLAALDADSDHVHALRQVQHLLFDFGGELSLPGRISLQETDVAWLEQDIARLNQALAPLAEFVLPGPPENAALIHVVRTFCRRLERRCWALQAQNGELNPCALTWLNRLSDWLFVLARTLACEAGEPELQWQPRKP